MKARVKNFEKAVSMSEVGRTVSNNKEEFFVREKPNSSIRNSVSPSRAF